MKTLPALAQEWRVSLDALRTLVRRSPELRALGVKFGPTRAFDTNEAEQIRKAFDQRGALAVKT